MNRQTVKYIITSLIVGITVGAFLTFTFYASTNYVKQAEQDKYLQDLAKKIEDKLNVNSEYTVTVGKIEIIDEVKNENIDTTPEVEEPLPIEVTTKKRLPILYCVKAQAISPFDEDHAYYVHDEAQAHDLTWINISSSPYDEAYMNSNFNDSMVKIDCEEADKMNGF